MSILGIIIAFCIVVLIFYVLDRWTLGPAYVKQIIQAVVVIVLILFLLQLLGVDLGLNTRVTPVVR